MKRKKKEGNFLPGGGEAKGRPQGRVFWAHDGPNPQGEKKGSTNPIIWRKIAPSGREEEKGGFYLPPFGKKKRKKREK